jgi:hypothetical protein
MNVPVLRDKALRIEKGKRQINVADASEFMRALNKVTKGAFYKWVRSLPKRIK